MANMQQCAYCSEYRNCYTIRPKIKGGYGLHHTCRQCYGRRGR